MTVNAKKLNLWRVVIIVAVCLLMSPLVQLVASGRVEAADPLLANKAGQFLCYDYVENGIINSEAGVGSYALCVLTRAGIEVSTCLHNGVTFREAVIATVKDDLANGYKVRAKQLAQDLAAMKVLGQDDLAEQLVQVLKSRQSENGFEDIGALSIYSNIPAFDLLSGEGLINQINTGQVRSYILGKQYLKAEDAGYGSWGSLDNDQFYADFMATTEAVRTLYRLDPGKSDAQIQEAINNGLAWIKNQQKADGSFVAGMDDPVIDTCEVIVTLKTLERDPGAWQSSEGKSAVDYVMNKALNPDGSFGASKNAMDATWVLWACSALNGKNDVPPQVQSGSQAQSSSQVFRDIQGHWAENNIYRLTQMSVVLGYPDGTFKPGDRVTRNEIAAMMVRLLKPEPAQEHELQIPGEKFKDAGRIPQWVLGVVAVALREGLISGYPQPDGTLSFEGERQLSRAELAAIMARIIEKKYGPVTPEALNFTDADIIPEWAKGAIGVVYAKGIAGGYPDRTFRAENTVTRAEAASMIMRLADQLEKN